MARTFFRACSSLGSFPSLTWVLLALSSPAQSQVPADGTLIQFNDNGAWSWFQDERAIIDPNTNQLLISSIAADDGPGGAPRDGDVDLVAYNLSTGANSRFTLIDYTYQADDHNSAALMVRPDGRYLAVYAAHQNDSLVRWRVSTNPGDATAWQAEQTYAATTNRGTTYSNVFYLTSTATTYNFYRANNYDPHVLTSSDGGSNWAYGGHLLMDPTNNSGQRPYLKYASNGTDRIYFTTTEAHPRDVNTGIYAGYMSADGQLHRLDGTDVGSLGTNAGTAVSATAFTTVLAPSQVVNGTPRTRAWTTDIALDSTGNPYMAFTSRVNGSTADHRFYYARWNGTTLAMHEIAKAGGFLYAAEDDYTGLAALSPSDPNTLYISTKIDPRDSTTNTARYEIYRGFTHDGGANWTWVPITAGSSIDNLRPIVPKWNDDHTALIWFRGTYTTYQNWNAAVVGKLYTGNNGMWKNPAGGAWDTSTNWDEQRVASGMSFIADFSTLDLSGDVTINLSGARTIGLLTFGDTSVASPSQLVLSGSGSVTLDAGVVAPVVTVRNQSATIQTPIAGAQGLVKAGTGSLLLSAANSYTGSTVVSQGTLIAAHPDAFGAGGPLTVANAALARLAPGLAAAVRVTALSFGGTGKLDITDNGLIVDYSVASLINNVRLQLAGAQIFSSTSSAGMAIGYGEASVLYPEGGSFRDTPVDTTMVLLESTWLGDATLDGVVDELDLGALAVNWQSTSRVWTDGDFNYDGTVDITDLQWLATNWYAGSTAPTANLNAALAAAGLGDVIVPEPAIATTTATFALLVPLVTRYGFGCRR